ncbi:hypothetical protein E4U10_005756 [Claviceps purpurea]|nr:hypothetical protein E4U10_005756 [Claviceps purpurea]
MRSGRDPKAGLRDAVAKWQTVADGTEDCDLRDKTWGRAAYTTPVQRDTDGDVQMTGVNATGFTNKKSKKTGNASAKAGTRPGKTTGVRVCDVSEETEEDTDSDDSEKDLPSA